MCEQTVRTEIWAVINRKTVDFSATDAKKLKKPFIMRPFTFGNHKMTD